jgi:alkanesulfonate monooxygenase SsuD/methylene tetrahydromethanopterin reductase-like flavin-dependent oxidoreductase (luciferase family)
VQQSDPIRTAKLVASVDQVSNGRFLFGVGGGFSQAARRTIRYGDVL